MPRGFSRQQIGVTEALIETFGDVIFRMSHNYQERQGDPYRNLDWPEIERQRENMGLADAEIAQRIGLTRDQVLHIRTTLEHRRFHTGYYVRLLDLGGGKRFRAERFTPHDERPQFSVEALELRAAMRYPSDLATKYIQNGWWSDDTLHGWLDKHAAERPDSPAIQTLEGQLSYGGLHEKVAHLARAFYEIGIGPGDVVAIQLPNIPEYLIAYLAIARLGAVITAIHMPYRAAECESILKHSRAKAVICFTEEREYKAAEQFLGLRAMCPKLEHIISLGSKVDGTLSLSDMVERRVDIELPEGPVASDPFLLLYTSGTTSSPKGVPLSYHNILSNARLNAPELALTTDGIHLSATPYSHLYGLYSFHLAMAVGACNLLLPVFKPVDLVTLIENGRPSAVWTAPAHIAACMQVGLLDKHDLSSLKLVIFSGSACSPELVRTLEEKLAETVVVQQWGMTELQSGIYTRLDDPPGTAARTTGRPSPGTEARVVDPESGEELEAGEEGELQVRGCHLFPGYLRNEEANATAFTADGWFRTGDLARRDKDHNFAITGRITEIINRGGLKYNPRVVEELLDSHPKILQSAIVPMPDTVLGEKACAFVTLAPGVSSIRLEELCEHLLQLQIAKNKLPERLVVVDEMPLTPTRKVIKGKLKIPGA